MVNNSKGRLYSSAKLKCRVKAIIPYICILHIKCIVHLIKAFTNLLTLEPHKTFMQNMGRFCYYFHFINKETEAWPGIRGSYPMCELKLRAQI